MGQALSLNLVSVGILFGVMQIMLLVYLFIRKRHQQKIDKWFIAFMLALLIAQTESFLNRSGWMAEVPHLLNVTPPFIFLFGPFLYLHTRGIVSKAYSNKHNWLHFLPFVLYFAYSFFFFLQPAAYKYNAFVTSFQPELELLPARPIFDTDPWGLQGLVVVELLSLHALIYALLAFRMVWKSKLKQPMKSWLQFINGLLAAGALALLLSQGGVVNGRYIFPSPLPDFMADLFPTLATYAITFLLLKDAMVQAKPKYYKSSISPELKVHQSQRLTRKIEAEKLYLDPDFSLNTLAKAVGLSPHHLSQILNEALGCTFHELTHQYRIAEAKAILDSGTHVKLEQLAFDLGYGSKSTFFNAFKKATGLTPSKYREIQAA